MTELVQALKDNWVGHEVLQARALHKAPKYGRDDDTADALARQVMELWTEETWKYKTQSTGRQFRPGMLSWNYWVADSLHPARQPGRAPARQVPLQRALPLQRRGYQRTDRQRQLGRQGAGRQSRRRQGRLGGLPEPAAQRRQPHHDLQPLHPARPRAPRQVQGVPAKATSRTAAPPCRST